MRLYVIGRDAWIYDRQTNELGAWLDKLRDRMNEKDKLKRAVMSSVHQVHALCCESSMLDARHVIVAICDIVLYCD
jgi:NRPS condensation-like uncharacterized protein